MVLSLNYIVKREIRTKPKPWSRGDSSDTDLDTNFSTQGSL